MSLAIAPLSLQPLIEEPTLNIRIAPNYDGRNETVEQLHGGFLEESGSGDSAADQVTIQPPLRLIASLSEEIKCYEQKSNVWLVRNISTPSYYGR